MIEYPVMEAVQYPWLSKNRERNNDDINDARGKGRGTDMCSCSYSGKDVEVYSGVVVASPPAAMIQRWSCLQQLF